MEDYDDKGHRKRSKEDREPGIKAIRPVNESLREVSDYRQYSLVDRQQKYVLKHIRKYARHISGQLKSRTLNPADPITVLKFLTEVAVACD